MEQQKVKLVETEDAAMAAAVETVNKSAKKDAFVMNGGSRIPYSSSEPFGLTAFGETLDADTVRELYHEVLAEKTSFNLMARMLNSFVGKTIKAIEVTKTRTRDGIEDMDDVQEIAEGRFVGVKFADGGWFSFDCHDPMFRFPEGTAFRPEEWKASDSALATKDMPKKGCTADEYAEMTDGCRPLHQAAWDHDR